MIRWSYVLPRLALLLVVLVVAHFGLPPLLRWTLVRSLESTTGTEVDVAGVWTSFTRGEIRIGELRVAHDASSTRNVLQFDSARLALDMSELTHQRYIIDQAQIHGLKFNTPRTGTGASSHDIELTDPGVNDLARRGQQQAEKWLRQVTAALEIRLEDEFESIRLARQLAQRWPEDFRQLQAEARRIRLAAIELHQAFTRLSTQTDRRSQIAVLQRRWSEVSQLRERIATLHRRATQLAGQIQVDRDSIDTALQRDRDNLREKLRMTQLDDELLSNYLLDAEARRWWDQLRPWLELAGWLTRTPDANTIGDRGRYVQYGEATTKPRFLIRAADLDGQLWFAGHQVDFAGQARNLRLVGQYGDALDAHPSQLKLTTRGPFTAQIQTQFDTVAGTPRQQVVLRCDDLSVPARRWGATDGLHLAVAPSTLRLQARLVATRGRLDGRFRVTQQGIELEIAPVTNAAFAPMLAPLTAAAAKIDRIDILVDISGTLAAPQWQLQSDLGSQLREQLQLAAEQIVREQAERLAAEAQLHLDAEQTRLQQQLADQQQSLQQQLDAAAQVLSGLAQPVASRFKPLGNLLRQL